MSPRTTPKRSPNRTTPRRSPLQERSASQKNEAASRLHRDLQQERDDADVFTITPFPTKPAHVLRPSAIKQQKSRQDVENELPSFFARGRDTTRARSARRLSAGQAENETRRAPNLQLKQSVTALRDIYEAQAERSRPSTAAPSPALRSSTAGSRLRSISSSEGLASRSAWQALGLPKISTDDPASLPTLSEDTTQQTDAPTSFAWRMQNQARNPDLHLHTSGVTSSHALVYNQVTTSSDPVDDTSSSIRQQFDVSSPNVVQLGFDTSILTDPTPASIDDVENQPSPNVVKLGTTPPRRSTSPALSESSTSSRKRKRSDLEGAAHAGHTPIFPGRSGRARRVQPVSPTQSPTRNGHVTSERSLSSSEDRVLPSSPPNVESSHSQSLAASSSPIIRLHGGGTNSEDDSIVSAHANLQNVLTSSPGPIIQYPIVTAPKVEQFDGLTLQKQRRSQDLFLSRVDAARQLSSVPAGTERQVQELSSSGIDLARVVSRSSMWTDDLDDRLDHSSHYPTRGYVMQHDRNGSQVPFISDADQHEASDGLAALPKSAGGLSSMNMMPAQAWSQFGHSSHSGSHSRLNSMRTSIYPRLDSGRSYRPGSSDSQMTSVAVPTWARKYYSGFYRHSFQNLYQSTNNIPVTHLQPPARSHSIRTTQDNPSRPHTSRKSFQSVRSSIKNFMPSLAIPSTRPRMTVRKSHLSPGIGPLVSNPVRAQSLCYPSNTYMSGAANPRHVSMPLPPADPRAHWNGIAHEPESFSSLGARTYDSSVTPYHTQSYSSNGLQIGSSRSPRHYGREASPHLHHDRHLESGSSVSRGYGHPYNRPHSYFDLFDYPGNPPSWFSIDLRDAQVICFMSGFLLPLTWFLAAVLPLPPRPASYHDIEKAEFSVRQGDMSCFTSRPSMSDWDTMDIVARLRLERHIRGLEEMKWQNARWWRKMNRWMCCVGLVVVVIVIVLAVIGTKGRWAR